MPEGGLTPEASAEALVQLIGAVAALACFSALLCPERLPPALRKLPVLGSLGRRGFDAAPQDKAWGELSREEMKAAKALGYTRLSAPKPSPLCPLAGLTSACG